MGVAYSLQEPVNKKHIQAETRSGAVTESVENCMSAATLNNISEICEDIGAWVPIVQTTGTQFILLGWTRNFRLGRNSHYDYLRKITFRLSEQETAPVSRRSVYLEEALIFYLPQLEAWFFIIRNSLLRRYEIDTICEPVIIQRRQRQETHQNTNPPSTEENFNHASQGETNN